MLHLAAKSPNKRSYTKYLYVTFGREMTKYTVIYGVHMRFWPTLNKAQGISSTSNIPSSCGCICKTQ